MLVRLQSAIGRNDLVEQMVLIPEPKTNSFTNISTAKSVNLIVAYNASPNSHTALDLAFWIAHQTRLATNQQVTVQAVYVVEDNQSNKYLDNFNWATYLNPCECGISDVYQSATSVLTQPKLKEIKRNLQEQAVAPLEKADKILWQARSLAEEWQGSFKSHLRFGNVAQELTKVVESEAADVLFMGCKSLNHPIIQTLGFNLPCAILGIPNGIDE
ncbi:universal stress protein [Nostoc sp. FACHB-152]|uniref:universal stress protein n=1 Tax=unclassified Nostoc TaxID=2593658 RepID=UPI00168323CA|nr:MULTISPECIES: universal stress protein [unclassified Nostoc]MBD2447650.1 universal stress protein [Nostoc sp. FACHB-152]MBD2470641.1 universal stress protein [Nostoc sp. FACHB-145]